ncbi:MAG TPA: WD40 repeat domain-containing protein, partial [Gemmataceae bacterium]|nr:WD40 repeat domain-containing protein [Gemmataceae bacterium]
AEGSRVESVTISPDGKYLLVSAWGKPVLSDGGRRAASAKDHLLSVWVLATGKRIYEIIVPGTYAGPVAWSPDGRYFAAGGRKPGPRITLYEMASGKPVRSFERIGAVPQVLAFSPDGRKLVSALNDTTILVWDLTARPGKP